MKICVNDIIYAFSTALDTVEGELAGATTYHARRVATLSTYVGKHLGFGDREMMLLAAAAILHDNAVSEYVNGELTAGGTLDGARDEKKLGKHCALGEANMKSLPFYAELKDIVLYHHERADGKGPFEKLPHEIPLASRIIHLADNIDVRMDFSHIEREKYELMRKRIEAGKGKAYDEETAQAYLDCLTYDKMVAISGAGVHETLLASVPEITQEVSTEELIELSDMFAKIIDYKSPFTNRHSKGIAEKAKRMGEYYGWGEVTNKKLYFTGAMHDVGKLLVSNDILEKPDKLTTEEFKDIQNHAIGTYVIMKGMKGLEDITRWASRHHEKLDGTGYPFGLNSGDLDEKDRLLACIDIYQALVEDRPYKPGMSHEQSISIMRNMVEMNKIDGKITDDIDDCFKEA